jgi:hypothetical protein
MHKLFHRPSAGRHLAASSTLTCAAGQSAAGQRLFGGRLAAASPHSEGAPPASAAATADATTPGGPPLQDAPPQRDGGGEAVSRCFLACNGSPCLRHRGHGASIGGSAVAEQHATSGAGRWLARPAHAAVVGIRPG